VQTSVNHEFDMLAFIGHSFGNSNVYLGAGPAVFGTESRIYNSVGTANINGVTTNLTGAPASFSRSNWMWGTAAQIGMSYYFDPTWFLDINYTYAVSKRYTINYYAPFVNVAAGLTFAGNAYITTFERVTTQAVAVSINKVF
jgi:opacity protein-like surface antigen